MILFSKNIKFLRKIKGLTQSELADKIEKKTNTISNYESGVSEPDYAILEKLVKIFDISADDLIYKDLSESKDAIDINFTTIQLNEDSPPDMLPVDVQLLQQLIRNQDRQLASQKETIDAMQDMIDILKKQKQSL